MEPQDGGGVDCPAPKGTSEVAFGFAFAFDRERELATLEQIDVELSDVEHALRRLDDGSYGTCEVCGAPIGDERLDALPAARLCVEQCTRGFGAVVVRVT